MDVRINLCEVVDGFLKKNACPFKCYLHFRILFTLVLEHLFYKKDFFWVHTGEISLGADIVLIPSCECGLDEVSFHEIAGLEVLIFGWSVIRTDFLYGRGMFGIESIESLEFHGQYFVIW